MDMIITIINKELEKEIIKSEKGTSWIHKKIVKGMLKEKVLKKDPLTLRLKPIVRGNLHLTYMNIKDDLIEKGYKFNIDFKMRLE